MQTARCGIRRYRQGVIDAQWHHLCRPVDNDWRRRPEAVPQARQRAERPLPRRRVSATDESLHVLCRANMWFMDGNFSLAPAVFDQPYVFRAPLGTRCISCVHALLPGKSEMVYMEMLEAVTDVCVSLGFNADPTTIVTDLEMAAMQDVTTVSGCDGRVWPAGPI